MSDQSNKLHLPFLLASQADKHVSVNEAFQILDVLVGQAIVSIASDPGSLSPQEGDAFLIGAVPVSEWSGKSRQLAIWRAGSWWFLQPQAGWQVRDQSANMATLVFDGTVWVGPDQRQGSLDDIQKFGLASTATAITPFTASLNEASWSARPTTSAGTGDLRIYMRKQALVNSCSHIFQNGFSGRAEVGLCGDDLYTIKTSADGTTWKDMLRIDPATSKVTFPQGLVSVQGVDLGHGGGGGTSNVAVGGQALGGNATGSDCTAVGQQALASNIAGNQNTAIGRYALGSNTGGSSNVGVGHVALFFNSTGANNSALGQAALYANTVGAENTAIGHSALASNTTGSQNTALGLFALYGNLTGEKNTALGRYAMSGATAYSNCTALGHNAQVTGNNQIQLGDAATTTYVYGAVQSRSDARDKADIRDTQFGLSFIRALRPVDYRWNYREDYQPKPDGQRRNAKVKSRSRIRSRFHSGLIAQEVMEVSSQLGLDFGGLQDHSRNGGQDVLTLGYNEFIAPLIRAVQELADQIELLKQRG